MRRRSPESERQRVCRREYGSQKDKCRQVVGQGWVHVRWQLVLLLQCCNLTQVVSCLKPSVAPYDLQTPSLSWHQEPPTALSQATGICIPFWSSGNFMLPGLDPRYSLCPERMPLPFALGKRCSQFSQETGLMTTSSLRDM